MIKNLLLHPATRGLDLDSPETTVVRRQIVREKAFLRKKYVEWYGDIVKALPTSAKPVLELGSGAGFLSDHLPNLISTDIFWLPWIDVVVDGRKLPFGDGSLRGIVMTNVLHHIPDVGMFMEEASRCLEPGGKIVMVEPWVSTWSRIVYTKLHHEPFIPEAIEWSFPSSGPLSSANGALPWIVLERDRKKFEDQFPELEIGRIRPFMPFRYLLSGGFSQKSLMPGQTFHLWRLIELFLSPFMRHLAMFAFIEIERRR